MPRVVTRCTNSTVTEAWASVLGTPDRVAKHEAGALVHMAQKKLPPLEPIPSVILARVGDRPAPPFWREQFGWDNGRYLARVGHRYLSVHFLKRAEKYDTFSTSLEPAIRAWLDAAAIAYGDDPQTYPVDRVSYGYVNTFEFPATDFDLSKYFRLNFGADVPSAQGGLAGMEVRFRFMDSGLANTLVTVQLVVLPRGSEEADGLAVQTKVNAETHGFERLGFGAVEALVAAIVASKETAKRVFFEIATPDTHTLMGAQYDQA